MRGICKAFLIIITSVTLASTAAAVPSPYRTKLGGELSQLLSLAKQPARLHERFHSPHFFARKVHGLGRINFVCQLRKLAPNRALISRNARVEVDQLIPGLFKCVAHINRSYTSERTVPAALAVIGSKLQVQFSHRETIYTVTMNAQKTPRASARIARTTKRRFLEKECGSLKSDFAHGIKTAKAHGVVPHGAVHAKNREMARVLKVTTQADSTWYQNYGEASNAEIAALFNAVEVIYLPLNVRFSIIMQNVMTRNYEMTPVSASAVLAAFRDDPDNAAKLALAAGAVSQAPDINILFTAKDLGGATVGLSYMGAACWAPKHAYALVRDVVHAINITTLGHEVGHLLGAQHEASGVMTAAMGLDHSLSAVSLSQIASHIGAFPQCAPLAVVGPNLRAARLTLSRVKPKDPRKVGFRGTLISTSGAPISGEVVQIAIGKKVITTTTNQNGAFKRAFSRELFRGQKKVTVVARLAQLLDGPSQQMTLRIS
jgi:hypothetical protein